MLVADRTRRAAGRRRATPVPHARPRPDGLIDALVAQLDSVSASDAEGCGFDPRRVHQTPNGTAPPMGEAVPFGYYSRTHRTGHKFQLDQYIVKGLLHSAASGQLFKKDFRSVPDPGHVCFDKFVIRHIVCLGRYRSLWLNITFLQSALPKFYLCQHLDIQILDLFGNKRSHQLYYNIPFLHNFLFLYDNYIHDHIPCVNNFFLNF